MSMQGDTESLSALMALIDRLRGEGGCPWDQRQTARSMSRYLLDECQELVAAIESGAPAAARDESGDFLFTLAFIVRLYERQNAFTWQEVCAELHAKMVRRHPHVFGHATARTEEELQRQWAEIKAAERRGQAGGS